MTEIIPIFPLNVVLLPRMPLPLHIFEDRYKQMLADCEADGISFGVVPVLGSRMSGAGCIAEIERVIQRYEDGRADILTFGTQRFIVARVHRDKEYLEAEVEYYRDAEPDGDPEAERLAAHARELLVQFAETQGQSVDEKVLARIGLEDLSFLLSSTEVFNHREKHAFLQMRSPTDRLRRALPILAHGIQKRNSRRNLKRFLGKAEDLDNLFN